MSRGTLCVGRPDRCLRSTTLSTSIERGARANNGSPSVHANAQRSCRRAGSAHRPYRRGRKLLTAILAELTGPSGRVSAIESRRRLAKNAGANLAGWSNLTICGDGSSMLSVSVNRSYVNFGGAPPAGFCIHRSNPLAGFCSRCGWNEPREAERSWYWIQGWCLSFDPHLEKCPPTEANASVGRDRSFFQVDLTAIDSNHAFGLNLSI
jgi:hypothetical protein